MKPFDLPEANELSTAKAPPPCIVISQPMYFPWVGMLEQIRLCDTFVFYDDVQFSRGSFSNRVQIKTNAGIRWLNVPLNNQHLGQLLNEVEIQRGSEWRGRHMDRLRQAYMTAPYKGEMLDLVDEVLSCEYDSLAELSKASMLALIEYFDLKTNKIFAESSTLPVSGRSTQRVVDLCRYFQAKSYLTGHGARNYLEYSIFEAQGIDVFYAGYGLKEYSQAHGPFTPYVTALDLVAHCGKAGGAYISGKPISWREFLETPNNTKQEKK